MRKRLLPLACSLAMSTFLWATWTPVANADYIESLELGLNAGYRVDELDWNIAGNIAGTNPNILSELTWKDVKSYQVGVGGKIAVGNDYVPFFTYIRGSFNYGWITDGENQDSDFNLDNRAGEFSRSNNLTEDDNVLDATIGLGFQWKLWQNRLAIAPLGGYSYHEQNLRLSNGFQTIAEDPVDLGPIAGLDSTYETEWSGPWAGFDLELTPTPRFKLFGSFEYHWAEYEAEADWNLRADFVHPVSFLHEADEATGFVVKAGAQYAFTEQWAASVDFQYQEWEAEDGVDTTYFASGDLGSQKFNEVNWESQVITIGVTYLY